MAAGFTPRIRAADRDVCPNCEHTDCRANRELIASECSWCHQPLGQAARFYFVSNGAGGQTVAHAACEEDAAYGR